MFRGELKFEQKSLIFQVSIRAQFKPQKFLNIRLDSFVDKLSLNHCTLGTGHTENLKTFLLEGESVLKKCELHRPGWCNKLFYKINYLFFFSESGLSLLNRVPVWVFVFADWQWKSLPLVLIGIGCILPMLIHCWSVGSTTRIHTLPPCVWSCSFKLTWFSSRVLFL